MRKLMARISICLRLRHTFHRQSQEALARKYATFLPEDLRFSLYRINHAEGGPGVVSVPSTDTRQAAVLFADISGFTRLTEVRRVLVFCFAFLWVANSITPRRLRVTGARSFVHISTRFSPFSPRL
jgi:class 3 adenylate cyclase